MTTVGKQATTHGSGPKREAEVLARAQRTQELRSRKAVSPSDMVVHTSHEKNTLPAVREGLRILDPKDESFEEKTDKYRQARVKYAPMRAHKEMAATVLATGGTFNQAAERAGVSARQVKKYYTEAEFRARIEELRTNMFSKVRGRIIKEIDSRTAPGKIERIELLDLLRVMDRVMPQVSKGGVNIAGDVNVGTTNYDTIVAAILSQEPSTEEPDFPVFTIDGSPIPSEDSFE